MIETHTETAWELDTEELRRWDEAIEQNSRAWDEAIGLIETTDNGSYND
jgi:ferric-dicitrate binding protein FerR (iron transport regulator)